MLKHLSINRFHWKRKICTPQQTVTCSWAFKWEGQKYLLALNTMWVGRGEGGKSIWLKQLASLHHKISKYTPHKANTPGFSHSVMATGSKSSSHTLASTLHCRSPSAVQAQAWLHSRETTFHSHKRHFHSFVADISPQPRRLWEEKCSVAQWMRQWGESGGKVSPQAGQRGAVSCWSGACNSH